MKKKKRAAFIVQGGKCLKCGKDSLSRVSHYCSEHMDEELKRRIREEE